MEEKSLPIALKAKREQTDIVLFNHENPRSLVNLLPESVAKKVDNIRFEHPEYFGLEERGLADKIREKKDLRPSATINRLRFKLWEEYERVQGLNLEKMEMKNFYRGICASETFDALILYPHNLAWLMCPPANYLVMLEEALLFGIEQMREILEVPVIDPKTKTVNTRLAELKVKITLGLDERLNGATPIKIEQVSKNLNMSINTSDKGLARMLEEMTEEELERTLATLQKRERKKERDAAKEAAIEAEVLKVE